MSLWKRIPRVTPRWRFLDPQPIAYWYAERHFARRGRSQRREKRRHSQSSLAVRFYLSLRLCARTDARHFGDVNEMVRDGPAAIGTSCAMPVC